jgi:hypothetical protein
LKLAPYLLTLSGLAALGCPLLVDDRLEIVSATPDEAEQPVGGAAGAGSNEPAPVAGGADQVSCGVPPPPAASATCPAGCDRCEGGQCVFECSTQDACKELELSCPEGIDCKVECTAQAACTKAVVVCSSSYDCNVECSDTDACKEMNVRCSDGSCQVNCSVDKACDRARVTCGTGRCGAECLGPMAAPMLECGSACSCNPC